MHRNAAQTNNLGVHALADERYFAVDGALVLDATISPAGLATIEFSPSHSRSYRVAVDGFVADKKCPTQPCNMPLR